MRNLLIPATALALAFAAPVFAQSVTAAANTAANALLTEPTDSGYTLPTSGSVARVNAILGSTEPGTYQTASARTGRARDVDARVPVADGMTMVDAYGLAIGPVVRLKRQGGQITRLVVQTGDGSLHRVPPASVAIRDNVAVTGYSADQIADLPLAK